MRTLNLILAPILLELHKLTPFPGLTDRLAFRTLDQRGNVIDPQVDPTTPTADDMLAVGDLGVPDDFSPGHFGQGFGPATLVGEELSVIVGRRRTAAERK